MIELERDGYKFAEYHGKYFRIYTEINSKTGELQLLDNNWMPWNVNFADITLIEPDSKKYKKLELKFKKIGLI